MFADGEVAWGRSHWAFDFRNAGREWPVGQRSLALIVPGPTSSE